MTSGTGRPRGTHCGIVSRLVQHRHFTIGRVAAGYGGRGIPGRVLGLRVALLSRLGRLRDRLTRTGGMATRLRLDLRLQLRLNLPL